MRRLAASLLLLASAAQAQPEVTANPGGPITIVVGTTGHYTIAGCSRRPATWFGG